jgi:proton-coupled amino acid transporter
VCHKKEGDQKNTMHNIKHAATHVSGEEPDRLKSAAMYFGIKNTRAPLKPVRQVASQPSNENSSKNPHSKSILKFGSTVWSNVGLLFSDSTLEAARMHSVGVMTQEERIAGDGTLHLMSISRRKKGTEPTYKDLMDLFHQKPLEPLETVRETEDDEYEEVVLDSVEGGSLTAAIFGIVKGTVGPAVLYLPRGFALSGYAVAIPAMIIATISYLYSATRLLQCWKVESDKNRALAQKMEELRGLLDPEGAEIESKKQYGSTPADLHCAPLENAGHLLTYPELARRAFGKASVLISGGIAAMQFGVCLTYLIFVPQNLFESTRALFGVEIRREIFLAGMLVLEIPLVWIRDIRKLTPFNILATIFIAFGLVSVLFIALFGLDHPATAYQVANEGEMYQLYEEVTHLSAINPTWFLFIGTSFFCFEGSITLLVPLQEAVYKKEDRENFLNVNRRVTSSIVAFYIVFATICW